MDRDVHGPEWNCDSPEQFHQRDETDITGKLLE